MWSATNEDKGEILLIEGMVTGGNGLAERVGVPREISSHFCENHPDGFVGPVPFSAE